ncbi:MAG: ATP-binding protein [Alphaproteobacteria bacterium]|nr:ATP-binding protein [Alphaproteobacteria bacterium]
MELSFKKNKESEDLVAMRDIADDVIESDFIPYACHYDADTILTKNGELLQTLKIVGFSFEAIESEGADLRETIRRAIGQGLDSNNFAVWFHTIRRRKNLNPGGKYKEIFPKYVHDTWNKRHDWEHKYINELFITIVRDGETSKLNTIPRFTRAIFTARDVNARENYLLEMHAELNIATAKMLDYLKVYGAHKLTTEKRNGKYYSEPLRFLGKILKLTEEDTPLQDMDLSDQLATHDVTFGFDAMEVRSPEGTRRFGAMLTIKEYRELSLAAIDEFLQLPEEFIITQSMDFIHHTKAYKAFKFQHYIAGISDDEYLSRISGLQDIIDSDHGQATDYSEQQLTIFLVADDVKHLNRYIERTIDALNSLGIVAMREDLQLEESYWAQLPGNFPFLKRLKPINSKRIGGFANLSNYPAGKIDHNHWGPAVTVFNTASQTPYFFNFHINNVGHTTIIGPYGAGKTVLMNFLVSEARKFNNKLFFFDQNHGSEIFLRSLSGKYSNFAPGKSDVAMNPFQFPDSPANRNFLILWAESLVCGASGLQLNDNQDKALENAVAQIFSRSQEKRTLREFAEILKSIDPMLGKRLAPWHSGGSHSGLFDHATDNLNFSGLVHGFEMADLVKDRHSIAPTMLYLIQRIMAELDGTPTIIVLDEAWGLMDNSFFAPRLHGWLEALTQHNAMAIFATESIEDVSQSALSKAVFADMATQIYLPNPMPSSAYQTVFGLNPIEFGFLELMDSDKRHFLLKKGDEAIVASLSLEGMNNVLNVLSGTPQGLEVMRKAIKEKGANPTAWVPWFMERMNEVNG